MVTRPSTYILMNERPAMFPPRLACVVGIEMAVILQQIHYWLETSEHVFEGKKWVYNSVDNWQKDNFPYLTKTRVRRALTNAERLGILQVGQFNRAKFDKTKWYTLNYDLINLPDFLTKLESLLKTLKKDEDRLYVVPNENIIRQHFFSANDAGNIENFPIVFGNNPSNSQKSPIDPIVPNGDNRHPELGTSLSPTGKIVIPHGEDRLSPRENTNTIDYNIDYNIDYTQRKIKKYGKIFSVVSYNKNALVQSSSVIRDETGELSKQELSAEEMEGLSKVCFAFEKATGITTKTPWNEWVIGYRYWLRYYGSVEKLEEMIDKINLECLSQREMDIWRNQGCAVLFRTRNRKGDPLNVLEWMVARSQVSSYKPLNNREVHEVANELLVSVQDAWHEAIKINKQIQAKAYKTQLSPQEYLKETIRRLMNSRDPEVRIEPVTEDVIELQEQCLKFMDEYPQLADTHPDKFWPTLTQLRKRDLYRLAKEQGYLD